MVKNGVKHRRHAVQGCAVLPSPTTGEWSRDRRNRRATTAYCDDCSSPARPGPCRNNDRAAPGCTAGLLRSTRYRHPHKKRIVDNIVMRQRCAFRRACRTTRKLDVNRRVDTAGLFVRVADRSWQPRPIRRRRQTMTYPSRGAPPMRISVFKVGSFSRLQIRGLSDPPLPAPVQRSSQGSLTS